MGKARSSAALSLFIVEEGRHGYGKHVTVLCRSLLSCERLYRWRGESRVFSAHPGLSAELKYRILCVCGLSYRRGCLVIQGDTQIIELTRYITMAT
ncbi:hypothetical protein BDW69DRAFT_81506 [Aspergillus filifer]